MSEAEIDYLRTKLQEAEAERDKFKNLYANKIVELIEKRSTIANQKALLDKYAQACKAAGVVIHEYEIT